MEFLKLIYLSLIKKPKKKKKKEEASFPISLECFVFFFFSPWTILLIKALLTHTVKGTLKLSHGHTESAERTW